MNNFDFNWDSVREYILKYMDKNNVGVVEMAKEVNCSKSHLSKFLHYKADKNWYCLAFMLQDQVADLKDNYHAMETLYKNVSGNFKEDL